MLNRPPKLSNNYGKSSCGYGEIHYHIREAHNEVEKICSIEQTCFADGVLPEVVTVFSAAGELVDCLSRGF